MIYLWHGTDDFTRAQALRELRAALGDPEFAELNTTSLDGKVVTIGELQHHAFSIPFLANRRLVIVNGLVARFDPRRQVAEDGEEVEVDSNPDLKAELLDLLPQIPPTTDLVLLETKKIAGNNSVLKWADKATKTAKVRLFEPPAIDQLPDWVFEHVEDLGGQIQPVAANDLALAIGPDLRALDNEIQKVIVYRNGEIIRREDVRALVAPAAEQNIFDLVDSLGARKTTRALELLHQHLRERNAEFGLLGMITRQYRLLLQIRDLSSRGMANDAIQKQLGVHPFVVKKLTEQARSYSIPQLEGILRQLLDTDLALKTSRLEPALALDLLVIDLTTK